MAQSFTRQLAFGGLNPSEYGEGRSNKQEFYNGQWGNFMAKLFTGAILMVTALTLLLFYLKDKQLEELYIKNNPPSHLSLQSNQTDSNSL